MSQNNELTDQSIMQYGIHKNETLEEIDDEYLLWMLDQLRQSKLYPGSFKSKLLAYLIDNEDALITNIKRKKR